MIRNELLPFKQDLRQKQKMLAWAILSGVWQVLSNHTYKVGEQCYLQAEGGQIGLTVAISPPFMMMWDQLYLKMVEQAGPFLRLYERYGDDCNHVADVPPPGSKYDKPRKKVVYDETEHALRIPEDEEDRRFG